MSRIFWDTNLFIYLLEDSGERAARVASLRQRMLERNDQLYTSTLTLREMLVKPMERGDESLRERYETALSQAVTLIPFDREAGRLYARVRQGRGLRAPDAVQLACAATVRTDLFITNDERLSRCLVPGIQFITSLEHTPI